MYLVFLKIPNKIVAGCDYAVPERYVNPAQDLELYLDIQRGSANGFETAADASAWAKPALEKIFRFVYSTPNAGETYAKAYVKAVPADAETAEHAERARRGMTAPYRTVGDCYPEWQPPVKGAGEHFTYDMSDFVASLDRDEVARAKKKYAEAEKKRNPGKDCFSFGKYVDGYDLENEPWMADAAEKEAKEAPDLVPCHATPELVRELGLRDSYLFSYRRGPWIEALKLSLCDRATWKSPDRSWFGLYYSANCDFGHGGKRRWLASGNTVESIGKEIGESLIDVSALEPFPNPIVGALSLTVPEMYRTLAYLGVVGECEKYKKG